MQYHQGLLRQRGHGWGALFKIGAKAVAKAVAKHAIPAAVQAVGGILESKQPAQTGQGWGKFGKFFTDESAYRLAEKLVGKNTPSPPERSRDDARYHENDSQWSTPWHI